LVGILITVMVGNILRFADRPFFGWLVIASAALGLSVSILSVRFESQAASEARERERHIREQGQAEVLQCTVAGAIEVEEAEDEGPGYFLDVGEGQLLYLQGQYLLDYVVDAENGTSRFPNRAVEVVRLQGSGSVLGVSMNEEAFTPSRLRRRLEKGECLPEDGELIPATLATLEEDLRRLARERNATG
jgi:hypothetical protein